MADRIEAAQIRIAHVLKDLNNKTLKAEKAPDWAEIVLLADTLFRTASLIYDELYAANLLRETLGRRREHPITSTKPTGDAA